MHPYLIEANELFEYTQAFRRDIHRHPELGFQEVRTAGIIAQELARLGLEVKTGVAETGVVAQIAGERPGPLVLLRFDMDALPITEETGAEYASQNPGVMHACGHDGHVAVGLAVAKLLYAHRHEFSGTVRLVFQPAEETAGAERMVAEGILENPRPDVVLAAHVWNEQPIGWIGVSSGPVMAAAEEFRLRVKGVGGHGALPHLAVDPILASAQIVTALQSIVSRNVSPLETVAVSVGAIQGGDAFNVIPPEVYMRGTIRTFAPQVRERVIQRFSQIVEATAHAMGCQVEIEVESLTPAVINDPQIAARVQQLVVDVLPEAELEKNFQTMGSEDMAFMMQDLPGCYFFVGSANPEKGLDAPHHHPRFDFDEAALPRVVALMMATVFSYLQRTQ